MLIQSCTNTKPYTSFTFFLYFAFSCLDLPLNSPYCRTFSSTPKTPLSKAGIKSDEVLNTNTLRFGEKQFRKTVAIHKTPSNIHLNSENTALSSTKSYEFLRTNTLRFCKKCLEKTVAIHKTPSNSQRGSNQMSFWRQTPCDSENCLEKRLRSTKLRQTFTGDQIRWVVEEKDKPFIIFKNLSYNPF